MNSKMNASPRPPEAMDELAMQNAIRKRYCRDWANTILQLTKRVQAVNNRWAQITDKICRIDNCRVSYYRSDGDFVVEVRIGDEVEAHAIHLEELIDARQYIEVLVMDKLSGSKLIAKHLDKLDSRKMELPG